MRPAELTTEKEEEGAIIKKYGDDNDEEEEDIFWPPDHGSPDRRRAMKPASQQGHQLHVTSTRKGGEMKKERKRERENVEATGEKRRLGQGKEFFFFRFVWFLFGFFSSPPAHAAIRSVEKVVASSQPGQTNW